MENLNITDLSEWVQAALERAGMSQSALAEELGKSLKTTMDRSKINKLVLAKRSLSADEMLAISKITGQPLPHAMRPVAVAGRVGAGAVVPLVDAYERGDGLYHVERPDQLPPRGVVAVEVEGDSMFPMYQPDDVLFFTRPTADGIPEEDIGRPCIVECSEGTAWVKLVKRGSQPGLWNLISLNPSAESVWDSRIKWAARVRLALPAEFVRRATTNV